MKQVQGHAGAIRHGIDRVDQCGHLGECGDLGAVGVREEAGIDAVEKPLECDVDRVDAIGEVVAFPSPP